MQLIVGSSLVVMLVMLAASMNQAMERTLARTGEPRNVILLGAGSEESVERSEVRNGLEQIIASSIPGILQTMEKPTISPEIHFNGMLSANKVNSQALVRGVRHEALWVHKEIRILEGRFPESGEIMIGRLAHQKLGISSSALQIGKIVELSGEKMVISGIFDAIGTVMEAEVWVPLQDLMTYTQRDKLSCVVVSLVEYRLYSRLRCVYKTKIRSGTSGNPGNRILRKTIEVLRTYKMDGMALRDSPLDWCLVWRIKYIVCSIFCSDSRIWCHASYWF